MTTHTRTAIIGVSLSIAVSIGVVPYAFGQQQPGPAPVTRTDLLKRTLPAGNFRDVQAAVVELGPGAQAPRHRHDVAVVAYVLEGTVENQFDGGATQVHKTGESWFEAPGTVHDVARNASSTARARLLIVYIGEEGKATSVPLKQ
jgi:quercetin dioxygenase-like cupin family protein